MSLPLATTDTITGVAGSATSITYTIFGDEITGGADTFKVLAQGQLPSTVGTLYTVPGATATIVKTIHLANVTAGTITARLNIKGTADANAILPPISILAGGFAVYADEGWKVYNDQGQLLSVGATGATGPGDIATDTIWDAKGDLAIGTGADTAARLAVAANGSYPRAASGETTGLEWQLNNLAASTAPAVTDDSGDGYSVGSRWIDTTADKEYICLDATVGAAVWTETTVAGLIVAEEGTPLASDAATLDFVGAGVVASGTGTTKTITIPGGGDVATDAIWDAAGDTAVGSGPNTAVKRKNNDGAAAAPAVTDDSGDGYAIGSRWLDTTADKEYVALDVTVGAAVWAETTGAGGGVTIEDEGTPLSTVADTLDFVGAGVVASGTGTTKTITIPGGGAGALILLEQHTAANSATLDFTTCISATYDEYQIEFVGIIPATNATEFWMRMSINGGSTYDDGASAYAYAGAYGWYGGVGQLGSNGVAQIRLGSAISNLAEWPVNGHLRLFAPASTTVYKHVDGLTANRDTNVASPLMSFITGSYLSTTAVNAFRFLFSSGNIASGTIRVYGLSK